MVWGDVIYTGVFYETHEVSILRRREPVLEDGGPLARRSLGLSQADSEKILNRML